MACLQGKHHKRQKGCPHGRLNQRKGRYGGGKEGDDHDHDLSPWRARNECESLAPSAAVDR